VAEEEEADASGRKIEAFHDADKKLGILERDVSGSASRAR
jgi:hypothetical protein